MRKWEENQIKAIANLLAHSVEGLATDKVTIVDTNGNVLSDILDDGSVQGLTASQLEYQKAVEDNIQNPVQTMLDRVLVLITTIVRVSATLDLDQKRITSQTSSEGAVTSRQETSETSSNTSAEGGLAGTPTNIPEYEFVGQTDTTSSSERTSLSETFQPSVTQEETL